MVLLHEDESHFNLIVAQDSDRTTENPIDNTIECRNCGEEFSSKWNLMTHRKSKHVHTVAICRNKLEGKCDFSDELCWWSHDTSIMNTGEQVKCYVCGKRFEKKAEMMTHRKLKHAEIVMPCKKHQIKQCGFQDQTCWYKHETESNDDSVPKPMNEEQKMETESVFQKVTQNLKPPSPINLNINKD